MLYRPPLRVHQNANTIELIDVDGQIVASTPTEPSQTQFILTAYNALAREANRGLWGAVPRDPDR